MNICINSIKRWLHENPRAKQWLWFGILWLTGLLAVSAIAYPIKWVMHGM